MLQCLDGMAVVVAGVEAKGFRAAGELAHVPRGTPGST